MSATNSEALSRLVALTADGYPFANLQKKLSADRADIIAPLGAHPVIVKIIADLRAQKKLSRTQLIVVATGREAEEIAHTLKSFDPAAEVLEFQSWETLPHERLSPNPETVGKRLKVLHRLNELQENTPDHNVFVITSIRAALQPVVAGLASYPPLTLTKAKDYFLPELSLKLVELAYHRVDMVTKRGEFAVRGGIVDIFATTEEHAVRLEFFGDELEELRPFSVTDQRSLDYKIDELQIFAAREIIITPSVAQRARQMLHEFPNLSTMLAKITEGIPVEGMESLAPVLTDAMVPFTEYLPTDALVTLLSPEKSAARAASLVETNEEFLHAAWDAAIAGADRDENSERAPIDLSSGGFVSLGEFTG
jgi:transcription-repair coupling factor (superfamily II helicase)